MISINRRKKYRGFSLVEMLLTIGILAIITLLVATTLTTLIKVSIVSNVKNQARNDVNFIMELMQRSLGNSNVGDISIYESKSVRTFNPETMKVETVPAGVGSVYTSTEGVSGNEIHVRSYGYNVWSCIGFFLDSYIPEDPQETRYGYLLKTTKYELADHSDCFDETTEVLVLHNVDVKVKEFLIEYLVVGDDSDNMFIVSSTVWPSNWPTGFSLPANKEITRQITVSSQGLTWY
ncbi:MAG: type II secretion system protein [Candidatus Dojkabacteria bacterium]